SRVEVIRDSAGPGNVCFLELRYENVTELLTGFGEKGVSAESVARRALREAWSYLSSDAPAGKYLSDQLLIPLALAGEGRMRCVPPSEHCRTNAETIRQFLPIEIRFDEEGPESWLVTVGRKRPVDVS
ncbi:MAG: RNA 3'-terminal phosphate cyclase, partial [Planctomycetota bacterium]